MVIAAMRRSDGSSIATASGRRCRHRTAGVDDVLLLANANARFLICYISKNVGRGGGGVGNNDNNAIVVPNLLLPWVVKLANRDLLA